MNPLLCYHEGRMVTIFSSPKRLVCLLSHLVMSDSATPQTVAHEAPLAVGLSWQEYWSGLPFPPPGALPNPGIKPESPALANGFFTTEPPGKPSVALEASSNFQH